MTTSPTLNEDSKGATAMLSETATVTETEKRKATDPNSEPDSVWRFSKKARVFLEQHFSTPNRKYSCFQTDLHGGMSNYNEAIYSASIGEGTETEEVTAIDYGNAEYHHKVASIEEQQEDNHTNINNSNSNSNSNPSSIVAEQQPLKMSKSSRRALQRFKTRQMQIAADLEWFRNLTVKAKRILQEEEPIVLSFRFKYPKNTRVVTDGFSELGFTICSVNCMKSFHFQVKEDELKENDEMKDDKKDDKKEDDSADNANNETADADNNTNTANNDSANGATANGETVNANNDTANADNNADTANNNTANVNNNTANANNSNDSSSDIIDMSSASKNKKNRKDPNLFEHGK